MSSPVIGRGQAVYNSTKNHATVERPRPLPCLVILVHGVNDIGGAYEVQDQGLCEGLNARLNRGSSLVKAGGDLQAASYNEDWNKLIAAEKDKAKRQQMLSDPDSVMFHRSASPSTYSPVIPFYWGFRERTEYPPGSPERNRKTRNTPVFVRDDGEWVDRWGNRLDKDGAKGGGPFANATDNVADMWGEGQGGAKGWGADAIVRDPLRPIKGTPPRTYMVLAAMRLARLIQAIRAKRETQDCAINLAAHSQGCLVSLLAQALLNEWGGSDAADGLILQSPPYSFDEPHFGGEQSTQARLPWPRWPRPPVAAAWLVNTGQPDRTVASSCPARGCCALPSATTVGG
jgi:hypothetical protein